MSLVNQMLKDLEQRRAELPRGDSLRGLRAAASEAAAQRNPWPALLIVAALGGISYGWWLTFAQPGMSATVARAPAAADFTANSNINSKPNLNSNLSSGTRTQAQPPVAVHNTAPALATTDIDADWDKTWEPRTAEAVAMAALEEPPLDDVDVADMAAAPETPAPSTIKTPAPRPTPTITATAVARVGAPSMHKTVRAASPAEQATQQFNDALAALRSGDAAHSEELLRAALDNMPGHTAAAETLAAVLLQQQRTQDAENVLINALAAAPAEPRLLKLHARILADAGRDQEAVALLQAPAFKSDADSQALLGALQQRLGNDVLATNAYRQALAQVPQRGAWWLGLAISLERTQQPADALAAYQRALTDRALGTQITTYVRGRIAALDNGQG